MPYKVVVKQYFLRDIEIGGWIWTRSGPVPVPTANWVKSKIKQVGKKIKSSISRKKKKKYTILVRTLK